MANDGRTLPLWRITTHTNTIPRRTRQVPVRAQSAESVRLGMLAHYKSLDLCGICARIDLVPEPTNKESESNVSTE